MQIPRLLIPHHRPSDSELDELYAMLVGYAVRRTDSFDEALDMVQEALTATLERTRRLGGVENFKAYCFQVLRSKLALRGSHHTLPLDAAILPTAEPEPCLDFLIDEALRQLPLQEQAAVRAHDLDGEEDREDDPRRRGRMTSTWDMKWAAALKRVKRNLPHALQTLKLIIRNHNNRKESICSIVMSRLSTRRNGNSRGKSTTATLATSPGSSPTRR